VGCTNNRKQKCHLDLNHTFVAITRATKWCYFSTDLGNPRPLLVDRLMPLASSRQITLRQSSIPAPANGAAGELPAKDSGDNRDFEFL
jgi:hypothetical protein